MLNLRDFAQKRICVAISGGVDSVVLLHYLKTQAAACGFAVSAVHCEHGIRGENSLADMRFTQDLCKEWGVPLTVFRADCPTLAQTKKCSLETAAREFRRECFARLIQSGAADFIATAHHALDEAETVLFRLARGASLSGAKGMTAQDGWLIRPILGWPKAEILSYAAEKGLAYRVDESNLEREYTRNKLRLDILPSLEEAVPGASRNLAAFALRAAEDDEALYAFAKELITRTDEGVLVAFCDKAPIFRRACLLALKGLGVEKDYTAAHLGAAFDLQKVERGAKLDLPVNTEGIKTENGILFRVKFEEVFLPKTAEQPFDFSGFDGGRYEMRLSFQPIDEQGAWGKVLRVDAEKIPQGASFRFRKDGDSIRVFGGDKKSLKKFLNERKVPVQEREYLPLIAKDNEVLIVGGVEISSILKVDENTKKTLYVALYKKFSSNA